MQDILLVNLMRMGDILQMTPLIQALREERPDTRISMLLNEAFVEVAQRIDVDTVLPFPVRSLVEAVSGADNPARACGLLHELVQSVNRERPYDLVINLTPSKSASSFSSLIAHQAHKGMWLGKDGSFLAADPWAAYLVTMTANRRTNPFHLVDIWLQTLGKEGPRSLQLSLSPGDVRKAGTLLTECGINIGRDVLVGFQVSASQREKCWSEKEFVRLGQALHQGLRARVLLFGIAGEEPLCRRIGTQIPGSLNLAGRTDIGSLAGVLRHCRALVTNDTGTQHVAAAVGIPVVVISVGPVFFRETGPYGEGHLVFQAKMPCAPCSFQVSCLNPVCKGKIHAQLVYQALVGLLRGEKGVPSDLPKDVSCYRSGFDREGWLEFSSPDLSPEDRKIRLYKGLWRGMLKGGPRTPARPAQGDIDPEALAAWTHFEALLRRSSSLFQRILRAGQGHGAATPQVRILSANLRSAEEEMRRLVLETEELAPVLHYLILRREALPVRDPLRFLHESSSLYSLAANHIGHRFGCPPSRKEAIYHG